MFMINLHDVTIKVECSATRILLILNLDSYLWNSLKLVQVILVWQIAGCPDQWHSIKTKIISMWCTSRICTWSNFIHDLYIQGISSPVNTEKMHRGSPVRPRYGVSFCGFNIWAELWLSHFVLFSRSPYIQPIWAIFDYDRVRACSIYISEMICCRLVIWCG